MLCWLLPASPPQPPPLEEIPRIEDVAEEDGGSLEFPGADEYEETLSEPPLLNDDDGGGVCLGGEATLLVEGGCLRANGEEEVAAATRLLLPYLVAAAAKALVMAEADADWLMLKVEHEEERAWDE